MNRRRGGCHRGETDGLLRPHARRLSTAVPISSKAEDQPGSGGILGRFGGAAFSGWASSPLCSFRRRAEHLHCARESPVRATELETSCGPVGGQNPWHNAAPWDRPRRCCWAGRSLLAELPAHGKQDETGSRRVLATNATGLQRPPQKPKTTGRVCKDPLPVLPLPASSGWKWTSISWAGRARTERLIGPAQPASRMLFSFNDCVKRGGAPCREQA